MRLAPAVVPLALLVVACNALTGVGRLDVADDDATTNGSDAGVDGSVVGEGDSATGDGAGGDSSVVVIDDGGGGDGDAAPLGFCASLAAGTADVCTDFDDGIFPGPWQVHVSGPSTATAITSMFRSSPRAAQFVTPGGLAGGAWLSKDIAIATPTEIILHYAVRYENIRVADYTEITTILLAMAGGNRYETQLELSPNGTLNWEEERPEADGGVPETITPLGLSIPPGQWRNVTITITIAQAASTVTFDVEGSAPVTKAAAAHLYKAAPTIVVGDNFPSTTAHNITFDNLYYRVK